jgi:hypothetical protein
MKQAIIDASSAILLHKAGLFARLAGVYRVRMAVSVYAEITRPGYPGAERFEDLCHQGRFAVIEPRSRPGDRRVPLDGGERDTVIGYLQGKADFVIIDDGPGSGFCRASGIPYINALLFPRILFLRHMMVEADYRHKTDRILRDGRYAEKIVIFAAGAGPAQLEAFLPQPKED